MPPPDRTSPHRTDRTAAVERRPPADPGLRASDADREATVRDLRDHGAAGRLDVDELEERVAAAYAARTRGELDPLLADLPAARRAPAAPRHRPREEWRVFLAVSVLLLAIWALSGAGYFWPMWVIGWWGAALRRQVRPSGRGRDEWRTACDDDGVLRVRGARPVRRARRPAVGVRDDIAAAGAR